MAQMSMHSPVGDLTFTEEGDCLVALDWGWVREQNATPTLVDTRDQLRAYFERGRKSFDLPLEFAGTTHQQRVMHAMAAIPYGQTRSYGELAEIVGSAPRAVGGACGRNPIPIIVPCHRVLAVDHGLGGYSGQDGLATKRFLLDLEGAAYL